MDRLNTSGRCVQMVEITQLRVWDAESELNALLSHQGQFVSVRTSRERGPAPKRENSALITLPTS